MATLGIPWRPAPAQPRCGCVPTCAGGERRERTRCMPRAMRVCTPARVGTPPLPALHCSFTPLLPSELACWRICPLVSGVALGTCHADSSLSSVPAQSPKPSFPIRSHPSQDCPDALVLPISTGPRTDSSLPYLLPSARTLVPQPPARPVGLRLFAQRVNQKHA